MTAKFLVFFSLIFLSSSFIIRAETFELKNGDKVEGTLIADDGEYFYIETNRRIVNVTHDEVRSRTDNAIYFENSLGIAGETLKEDIVAKVGYEKITKKDYKTLLQTLALKLGKPVTGLTIDDKEQVLNQAIEDSLFFQEAVATHVHEQPFFRDRIMVEYRLQNGGDNNPALPADEDALFKQAIQKGVHRSPLLRAQIIAAYLRDQNTNREAAAKILKNKYGVEIVSN